MRIQSIQQLKDWNNRYVTGHILTKEYDESKWPILLEWFLDWFFEEALMNLDKAKDAFNEYLKFTYICTKLELDKALERCIHNLDYWYDRASYYRSRSDQFNNFKSSYLESGVNKITGIEFLNGNKVTEVKKLDGFNTLTKPEVKTYQDLISQKFVVKGCYIDELSNLTDEIEVAEEGSQCIASDRIVAKSMLAMAMISQLIPYYGGAVTDEEWNYPICKFTIVRRNDRIECDATNEIWTFLAFHTRDQRDEFLKNNEQLVRDYLMMNF